MVTKNQTKRGKKRIQAAKKVVSRKIQREKNLFEMRTVTYEDIAPLTETWREYMKELIYETQDPLSQKDRKPAQNEYLRILRASYHMAPLRVYQNGCQTFTGVVLKETLSTFYMINAENHHRVVIKS